MHRKRLLPRIATFSVVSCGIIGLLVGFEIFRRGARLEAIRNADGSAPYSSDAQNDFVAYLWFAGSILALMGILFLIQRGRDLGKLIDRFRSA